MISLLEIKISYSRASRCWRSSNLRMCLQICDRLTREIKCLNLDDDIAHLKQLIWSLKIKCIAEDCYINESLLMHEDDIDIESQIQTFTSNTAKRPSLSRQNETSSMASTGRPQNRRLATAGTSVRDQRRTAIVTGRMQSASSHTSGRATSSYRPLKTSLVTSQTAFSRSTRPLLKYATNQFLSKITYEYLYNVQRATNQCPDYRQCLEYLNIVQQCSRERNREKTPSTNHQSADKLIGVLSDDSEKDLKHLDAFWLLAFGVCYFNLRINKIALEYFEAALRANDKQLDAYLWLIKIYLRQNEPMKVLKTCDDGLKNSKNAILYNWKARIQSLLNDFFAAHSSLRNSLEFYPTNIEALANVGHFSFYGDKLDQALKCFERINQLSTNAHDPSCISGDLLNMTNSSSELLNNLALCNLYCGNLSRVVPSFLQAFSISPNKETTSNIWYNLSFVPLSLGFRNLAMACLKLALKSDPQNEEAINNLGVLKFGPLINDPLHYTNRQELWSGATLDRSRDIELINQDQLHRKREAMFDEVETYFRAPVRDRNEADDYEADVSAQPEMIYNMALIKYKRGHLLSCVKYCQQYLKFDADNYTILSLVKEIRQLI